MIKARERFTFGLLTYLQMDALLQVVTRGPRLFLSFVSLFTMWLWRLPCSSAPDVWRETFVFCCCCFMFVCFHGPNLQCTYLHWLELSRMVAPNWREARSISYPVPRKKGIQACELWEGLCQVRSSSFIYQRTTEPLIVPGPGLICGSVTLEVPHSLGEVTYCRQRGWKRPLWSMSMSHTGE